MEDRLFERIKELADVDDPEQYTYAPEPYERIRDKMKADGVEIKRTKEGMYKIKLKIDGEFTGTQMTVNNKAYIAWAILKSLLNFSDKITIMRVMKSRDSFLEYEKKPIEKKYAMLMIGIERALGDIPRDQWEEYTVPIDLTFDQIFDKVPY